MRVASLSTLFRPLKIGAAALALGALSACATPGFRADVARFQQMPAPQGQTFSIEPRDETLRGGLEFNHYASLVTEQLTRYGYRAAPAGERPDFVVKMAYGVDNGRERVVSDPDPFWGPGWGYPGGTVSVHMPAAANGAAGTDGELIVIDGDVAYNFWQFKRTSTTTASAASFGQENIVTGDGWGSKSPFLSAGITAAGASQLGGLIVKAGLRYEKRAVLLGALIELRRRLSNDEAERTRLAAIGTEAFGHDSE